MSQDTLRELSTLCQQLRTEQMDAARRELELKSTEATIRRLKEEDIPALMTELAVAKIVLESGEEIKVGLEVYASITEANKEQAFKWLEDNGHGAIITTDVIVSFGKDEIEEAKQFAATCAEQYQYEPVMKRAVHASRLKSFIKERLESGDALPMDLFGARAVQTAKVK